MKNVIKIKPEPSVNFVWEKIGNRIIVSGRIPNSLINAWISSGLIVVIR